MESAVKDYFAAVPESRQAHLQKLHSLILQRFPQATLSMKFKMPTYGYGDGWVAIANQKHYVSLYTCGALHLVEFKKAFPEYKTGAGCINFREKQTIPEAAVLQVIEHAILHPKGIEA